MTEQQLVKYCTKKDKKAQKALFDKFFTKMYHVCNRYLLNHYDTEDVLSVAFTKVFDNIEKFEFREEGSLEKWIKTIVINASLSFLRTKKHLFYLDDLPQTTNDSDFTIEQSQNVQEILFLISQMPLGYRTVFNLFAIEGYSHKEIADKLNIMENTSKSQLHKARQFIISRLTKEKYYEPK